MNKKLFAPWGIVLTLLTGLLITGCDDLIKITTLPYSVPSTTPTINSENASVAKTTEHQKSVDFTLTSTVNGIWKVYTAQTGGVALTTATASFSTPTLTLTASGNDLEATTYYVSVTENGKTESGRLGLTVEPYVAPNQSAMPAILPANASVAKITESQKSVSFTLTSTVNGTWRVYSIPSGGYALTTVTASFSAPMLTLTATGDDLEAKTYYVTVTENGKTESNRLELTVTGYVAKTATPVAATASVSKTAATQKSVAFTLTNGYSGTLTWKVYSAASGGIPLSTVTASYSAPILTLTASGADLAVGTYYVSVTESGKTESDRAALTINGYTPDPEPTFMVAAGLRSSYVLKSDGALYAAGSNEYGQLGTGDTENLNTFTHVASGVRSVSSWGEHVLVLKQNGTVWVTGDNFYGQHGLGDNRNSRTSFTEIPISGVKAVSAGSFTSYFVKNDGSLWTVGGNTFGQQGTGGTTYTESPVQVSGVSGVQAVSAGTWHCLILKTDGSVWAAGRNHAGQLGTGDLDDRTTFTQVIDADGNPLSGVKAIAAGEEHSLILKSDGTIWGAGSNGENALGLPTYGLFSRFTQITSYMGTTYNGITYNVPSVDKVKMIAAGHYHSLIATTNNQVWAVGLNDDGQLGTGDTTTYAAFIKVADSGVVSMAGGKLHSILMKPDETVWTTGYNYDGLLGLGNNTHKTAFTQATVFNPGKSTMPTVSSAFVDKAGGTLSAAVFTLTNSPPLSGTWNVYASPTGSTLVSDLTASSNGTTLTLSPSYGSDIPAGTYYVTVTESGKTESNRLALTVSADGIPGFLVLRNTSGQTINDVLLSIGGSYVRQPCPQIPSGSSYTFTLPPGGYAVGLYYTSGDKYFAPYYPVSAGNTTTLEFTSSLDLIVK
jgi:alpha-tubulin suppressor-like RCC1 family protein